MTTVSAASYTGPVAPESIVAAFGIQLATGVASAPEGQPLPTQLGGTTVTVNGQLAQLFFVSPGQINYLIPKGVQPGNAEVIVTAPGGVVSRGVTSIAAVAPGIFTVNLDGKG
ncbi:MAG: hypothetical protein ACK559_06460, partial [bacterium]